MKPLGPILSRTWFSNSAALLDAFRIDSQPIPSTVPTSLSKALITSSKDRVVLYSKWRTFSSCSITSYLLNIVRSRLLKQQSRTRNIPENRDVGGALIGPATDQRNLPPR